MLWLCALSALQPARHERRDPAPKSGHDPLKLRSCGAQDVSERDLFRSRAPASRQSDIGTEHAPRSRRSACCRRTTSPHCAEEAARKASDTGRWPPRDFLLDVATQTTTSRYMRCQSRSSVQSNRVVMASSMDLQGVLAAGPMTGGQRRTPHRSRGLASTARIPIGVVERIRLKLVVTRAAHA